MREPIRVLLVDDHQMIRQGLGQLIAQEPGFELVAEADNGRAAVALARELSPDLVVMDIMMPDLNGIDATRQIRADHADGQGPRVIGLSVHTDRRFMSELFRAGGMGFVCKSSAFEELSNALRSVAANEVYRSPSLVGGDDRPVSSSASLTAREREVLQLLAEGNSTKQVARHLGVSAKTVESHRRNLMEKLQIDNIAELTKYAVREGITSVE